MKATTPDRWQRLQALFDLLETVPAEEHAARLRALEPDESLRRETLDLLQAMRDEEAYRPESAEDGDDREDDLDVRPSSVGGVRILERIGSGGSGDVFRGLRTVHGTEQLVAVKLFHAHRASAQDLDRFAREQRLLAALTHPDIVRLLDAGVTAEGRPYLVMDLAEGQPITDYCDQHRLKLADRLRLFLSVCDAVQSAHRHLIVHLDLKPSNILVSDDDGRVKLLDFGAAKLADPALGLTRTEPLTLLYASPERLRDEPVSVACDVFSLGLILFELASGAWPFSRRDSLLSVAERASGAAAVVPLSRSVTEEAALRRGVRQERLRAALRGDLEAIAAKAVAHEPADRYASVAELADDLRRYLAGEPVQARALGVTYRLGKFVRQHAWQVAGVVLLIVGLAAAALYSAAAARSSRRAAERAQTQNRFLTSLFTLAGSDSASRHDMTVRELLALAEERIAPVLGGDAAAAADVEVTLAQGYVSQDAFPAARSLLERAIRRAVGSGDVAREAGARASLAYVAYVQNENDEATRSALNALELWERHRRRFTPEQAVAMLATASSTLAYVDPMNTAPRGYFEACLEIASAALTIVDPVARAQCLRGLAIVYTNVDSRYDEADALLREAVEVERSDLTNASDLVTTLQVLGLVNRYRGRFADDEIAQREAYDIALRLHGAGSVAALWQRARWATSLLGTGRGDEARRVAQEVLAAARQAYPTRGSYMMWTPLIAAASASCLVQIDTDCEALATEAMESLGPAPPEDDPRLRYARGLLGLAWAWQGRSAEARPLIEGALAMETARRRSSAHTALWRAALAGDPDPEGRSARPDPPDREQQKHRGEN